MDPETMPTEPGPAKLATTAVSLGKLVRQSASTAWPHEAKDFTPWLAANLDILGDAIGLRLTVIQTELPVGKYWADMLLEDEQGRKVVVENQFGQTDHDHLGKLLTYCAGTDSAVVVWVAEHLTEEHLAAMEWLNKNTGEDIGFFGLELEVLRIGDSPMAPNFRVRVKPNQWLKANKPAARQEWTWESFDTDLNLKPERIEVGRALVSTIEGVIAQRALPWHSRFRKGYVTFQRPGDYNVLRVDLYYYRPPRLVATLPADLSTLGEPDPYPHLNGWWDGKSREWSWPVPTVTAVPDMEPGVTLVTKYQPASGPMPPWPAGGAVAVSSGAGPAPLPADSSDLGMPDFT